MSFGLTVQALRTTEPPSNGLRLRPSTPTLETSQSIPQPSSQRIDSPTTDLTSRRNSHPPINRRKHAIETLARQTGSLYLGDGYEPSAQEGRRNLNRDVLRAAQRFSPQHFDDLAKKFFPKSFARSMQMRMEALKNQRLDRDQSSGE